MKYFGFTRSKDPIKYPGSGYYWKRHIKLHGGKKQIETLNLWSFDSIEECRKFAEEFSIEHKIADSEEWANLMNETVTLGWEPKRRQSKGHIRKRLNTKMRNKTGKDWDENKIVPNHRLGKYGIPAPRHSLEHNRRVSLGLKGKNHSEQSKQKMREAWNETKYWWNDGLKCVRSNECPGDGWIRGRLNFGQKIHKDSQ
jgi:hypothetical protein